MPAVLVRLGDRPGVLVQVPVDTFDVCRDGATIRIVRHGRVLAVGARADEPYDPADTPLTGLAVAALARDELAVVAECWEQAARAALRDEQDPQRRALLRTAAGHARVLLAIARDVTEPPTAADFDAAAEAGLLTPVRLPEDVRPAAPAGEGRAGDGSPVGDQLAAAGQVARRVELMGGGGGRLRSRSAFAGLTAAAALVLTGCGDEPNAGDRRCTDEAGRVVDDSNCRTYGGGGLGGYFYRYGGSTYTQDGKTFLRGGSDVPSANGSGFWSDGSSGS